MHKYIKVYLTSGSPKVHYDVDEARILEGVLQIQEGDLTSGYPLVNILRYEAKQQED